uniref:C-type lectin domain family 2 member F n=1 Tax=Magallana gigas TaxID=29159 RepID=K1QVJ9_MAGGI
MDDCFKCVILLVGIVGAVQSLDSCPVSWIQYGNKCYYFSNIASTSELALSACLGFEAKLAEPMTRQEIAFLGQQVLVSDWGTSEPNNVTTENCVVIAEKPENRGHWADVDCRRQEHFICQKDCLSVCENFIQAKPLF